MIATAQRHPNLLLSLAWQLQGPGTTTIGQGPVRVALGAWLGLPTTVQVPAPRSTTPRSLAASVAPRAIYSATAH